VRYSLNKIAVAKKRRRRQTIVDDVSNELTSKWWGVDVRRGVSTLVSRIADEIACGNVVSMSMKWDGKDKVVFELDDGNGPAIGCVQLDARKKR